MGWFSCRYPSSFDLVYCAEDVRCASFHEAAIRKRRSSSSTRIAASSKEHSMYKYKLQYSMTVSPNTGLKAQSSKIATASKIRAFDSQ